MQLLCYSLLYTRPPGDRAESIFLNVTLIKVGGRGPGVFDPLLLPHGIIFLRRRGTAVRRDYTWCDRRSFPCDISRPLLPDRAFQTLFIFTIKAWKLCREEGIAQRPVTLHVFISFIIELRHHRG